MTSITSSRDRAWRAGNWLEYTLDGSTFASENMQVDHDPGGLANSARISVVIPCHNSPTELGDCLSALVQVNWRQTEYIVVDDGSDEDLTRVVSGSGLPVRLLRLPTRSGPAAARNLGARFATGEILVFLDADVCVHSNTLALIEESFAEPNGPDAVIGSYDDNPSAPGFHSQFRNLLHHYVHQTSHRQACTFWTGCGAVYRSIFELHGGFDESTRGMDDVELGGRLALTGARIDLRPDIQVQHRKRWTFFLWTSTDLRLRGIPWTMLLLRDGSFPNVLNLDYRSRASVALIWAALAAMVAAIFVPHAGWLALPPLAMALWLNRRLYLFFRERRGSAFAAGSVAAHSFHSFICGLSFVCGVIGFAFSQWAPRSFRDDSVPDRPDIVKDLKD
jgi:glycosyltransferase involved in cell wall biosynthesis